ncbi:hypothetical protein QEN19_000871 [Hanseniaspora menglaensis]
MLFILLCVPSVTFLSYIIGQKLLYLNINKLTTNDPVVAISNSPAHKLKTFNDLYIVADKKWNSRLNWLFNLTITLYFNIIAVIIYEIVQYEHSDNSGTTKTNKDDNFQQIILVQYYIPLMMQILSALLSFIFPFIIIFLGLKKFNFVKQKNLIFVSTMTTICFYQLIINNIIGLKNEEASILLKLALLGLIFMSSLSATGCVLTTYYHYVLSKNESNNENKNSRKNYSFKEIFKQIINSPENIGLYSILMDVIFLYYCNFKNLLTVFIKLPKSLMNLDIIYGLDKITTESKNKKKEATNPIVATIVNIINFFYYSQDEKVDEVLLIKIISILLSFSLFLLCFNYILSFLRNGLAIFIYYFDIHYDKISSSSGILSSSKELPVFNSNMSSNKKTKLPSHIKNFIFLEFLGVYILATILVILKLFLTKEFEEYLSRSVLSNWLSVNIHENQSALINTENGGDDISVAVKILKGIINLPQLPFLNKLIMIKVTDNGSILDHVQFLFDISFQITWGLVFIVIIAFELYLSKYSSTTDYLMINLVSHAFKKIFGH